MSIIVGPPSHDQIRQRLAGYRPRPLLLQELPGDLVRDDDTVAGIDAGEGIACRDLCRAGVLVPLVMRPAGLTVLLTERTAHLKKHAGQVSFPGGRIEPHDAGPAGAALREAEEEVGLRRDRVELIGQLDEYQTVTGYHITPVVGLIADTGPLRPDPNEVASIFEVPLSFLMQAGTFQRHERRADGQSRSYYAVLYQEHCIWGATAAMLRNLQSVLAETAGGHQ